MTALPLPSAPVRLLTVADYTSLPEDSALSFELQEGVILMSPRPVAVHQYCLNLRWAQLTPQLETCVVLQEVDVDLQLAPADLPGTVRSPDLAVVRREAFHRVRAEGGVLRADEVLLAIEVFSRSSRRTASRVKHDEYADAGIGHYWMIDLQDGPSLVACHLAGEFGYQDAAPARGTFTSDAPYRLRVDLPALLG